MSTPIEGPPFEQPASFEFMPENLERANAHIAKYPAGRQASAVLPLLWIAQEQHGWLPRVAMDHVAEILEMAPIRVYEVATFYTMFNLAPVGRFHVQVCGTTPCMLRGSDDVFAACIKRGLRKGQTTNEGLFTLTEVECLGACANAPMVQINDDNYEDLDEVRMGAILDALMRGETPKPGPQIERQTSCPVGGPATLKKMAEHNYDYRPQWTATAGPPEGAQ
jgi:NADH-quinone oxidoreductase subunit E